MRINTNISALNSQRILGQTNQAVSKQIGRLSSGFRINRAADDAAGLGIANKLRADIRGMEQAGRNAEQANSLLQVAEGATQTVQNIVDRMKELAVQSASDNVADSERTLIQSEFAELQSEITRIVDTTKFQGNVLLNGSMGNAVNTDDTTSTVLAAASHVQSASISGVGADTYAVTNNGDSTFTLSDSTGTLTQTVDLTGVTGQTTVSFDAFGVSFETTSAFDASVATDLAGNLQVTGTGDTTFMVSVSGNEGGQDDVTLGRMNLSLSTLGIDGDSLGTKAAAVTAIGNIDAAISTISSVFGDIGAAQNRLDYATNNVKTSIENFAAAESTIRDADMAKEMTELSRVQILQQAGTAMLAQANQAPQGVLQLLR